jgi:hypothetical protein
VYKVTESIWVNLWSRWQLEGSSEIACPTSHCKLLEDRILIKSESIIPPASTLRACALLWRNKEQAGYEKREGFVRTHFILSCGMQEGVDTTEVPYENVRGSCSGRIIRCDYFCLSC